MVFWAVYGRKWAAWAHPILYGGQVMWRKALFMCVRAPKWRPHRPQGGTPHTKKRPQLRCYVVHKFFSGPRITLWVIAHKTTHLLSLSLLYASNLLCMHKCRPHSLQSFQIVIALTFKLDTLLYQAANHQQLLVMQAEIWIATEVHLLLRLWHWGNRWHQAFLSLDSQTGCQRHCSKGLSTVLRRFPELAYNQQTPSAWIICITDLINYIVRSSDLNKLAMCLMQNRWALIDTARIRWTSLPHPFSVIMSQAYDTTSFRIVITVLHILSSWHTLQYCVRDVSSEVSCINWK